jgi:hypothetical protein
MTSSPPGNGTQGTFRVTNAKLLRKNSLIGSFDLEMPSGLIVRGAMLFDKDGSRWVNFPSKEWTKSDGTKAIFRFLNLRRRKFESASSSKYCPWPKSAASSGAARRTARSPYASRRQLVRVEWRPLR